MSKASNSGKSPMRPALESLLYPGEPKLQNSLNYIGQYKKARRLLMETVAAEKVALMTDEQVMEELQRAYAVAAIMPERAILVLRDKFEEIGRAHV